MSIIILIALVLSLVLLPSYIIQEIWNWAYSTNIKRDMSIELWQAALLWGACLTAIYMTGVFKFKIDFKTLDTIDLDTINDPELKAEIEKLKAQSDEDDEKNI